MYQLRGGGEILPISLPSLVKAENFSDHPRIFIAVGKNTVIVRNDVFSCGVIIAIWKKVDNSILTTSGIFVGKILWGNVIQYVI
jgi:hypothetical protein